MEKQENVQLALVNNSCQAIVSLMSFEDALKDTLVHSETLLYLKQIIPQTWLFPRLSAPIRHGEVGTTLASLRYV